jgi:very-short-patch-repair endonuclease
MQQPIVQYIAEINKLHCAGNATEHSYRPALKILLEVLMPKYTATNEPKRIDCGAPDYIITDRNFAVGYVEAKDIPVNLDDKSLKEQLDRYRNSLDNLIITNYLTFRWYIKGELVEEIAIGRKTDNKIVALNDNFGKFTEIIHQFAAYHTEGIKTSSGLSKQMAAKARLLAEIIEKALNKDIENKEETELNDQYEGFKSILIDTISTKEFADLYAQTIAYGMFAARINAEHSPPLEGCPKGGVVKSPPLEGAGGGFIAGIDLDSRISWVVDALADMFNYVDINKIHAEIGRYADNDPIIHFYETFLTDYDKKLKKQRGVWYTPQPVVRFIVQAVDEILKTDFGISDGLADSSKITRGLAPLSEQYHKVQILDPATGTGTFLAEVVNQIYKHFENQKGMWNSYVNEHLIPRLNGFEILMASYAMAHLKLEMLLQETKANISTQRLKIYLTDSLEPAPNKTEKKLTFAKWLTDEANEAAQIKRDTPIMVILGNPPYSGESSNNGKWIVKQIEQYKKDENGVTIENTKWLNNDYVKFIRLAQHFIEKNEEGILAFITDNSFLDSLTFHGMRYNLLKTFDKIYILNLHGYSLPQNTELEKDENVFDIQQGVAISIFIKDKKSKNQFAQVFYSDLFGERKEKYSFLLENNLQSVKWEELKPETPKYFFVPKEFAEKEVYERGFKINELYKTNSQGIVPSNKHFTIQTNKTDLINSIKDFLTLDTNKAIEKYELKESRDWKVTFAQKDLTKNPNFNNIVEYNDFPFDTKITYFTGCSRGFLCYPRGDVMQHFVKGENIGLVVGKECIDDWKYVFVTNKISSLNLTGSAQKFGAGFVFPLYLYPETDKLFGNEKRKSNLNPTIVEKIATKLGLTFVEEPDSPPLEGCPKGGVVNSPPLEECPKAGVVNSPPLEECPKGGVVNSPPLEGCPKGGVVVDFARNINGIPIRRNFVENLPFNPNLKQLAKDKRKAGILSEVLFWQQVHKRMFHNIDFDRQRIIGNYIVDFYVKTLGLVVEIDGSSHDNNENYDAERQTYLESLGLRVYRITDLDVKKNLSTVMVDLENYIVSEYGESIMDTPTPPFGHPSKGGELHPPFGHPSKGGELHPIDLLDYIYAVLHSPSYRDRYKEFLKIDFPRIPYPENGEQLKHLATLGEKLRKLHLMENVEIQQNTANFPIAGTNEIEKPEYSPPSEGCPQGGVVDSPPSEGCQQGGVVDSPPSEGCPQGGVVDSPPSEGAGGGRVFINKNQYFDNVPRSAWTFYICGYQPAQKWLKDRKGRTLDYDEIQHYQRIIAVLCETERIMGEIDMEVTVL